MSDSLPLRRRTKPNLSASTTDNLPPPPTSKPLKPVSPPLFNTRLHRLIYLLILLTALLSAYYSYRAVQSKTEVAGWWNPTLRRRPLHMHMDQDEVSPFRKARKGKVAAPKNGESVEDKINALAQALGMSSKDLASAIAVAVREYVPPASLSSIVAKESGTAVQEMLQGETSAESDVQSTGVVDSMEKGMDTFVGMEEPV
ncbi:hypothetical protein C0989_011369 [Termitomyces sp. Mn162]|nr:hypothetical protein C0989_011369 [Termitomyces sp. Mn162]KAH0580331.1 hypothetical protein H2248_001836 [Termitomyces sp. 'cryptogamus']